jgi:antitoxin component YwqK of YwqJK toxin-antitoxin module
MKLLLFFLLFSFLSVGQKAPDCNELEGVDISKEDLTSAYTGPVKECDGNNTIRYYCMYKNGKEHGMEKSWGLGGDLIGKGKFIDGKPVGTHRTWQDDGELIFKTRYKNGLKHGKCYQWFMWYEFSDKEMQGQLFDVTLYKNGKKSGKSLVYHKNGQIAQDVYYENDKRVSGVCYNEFGAYIPCQ